ncbi:MAG: thrB [Clostridiales bacterium]|jgi:homoserine kinase|nr:thrB [Clostridiales bacterium]
MIEIKVSATSANMGPGFDCLGIALNMFNRFYIEEIESGLEIIGCEDADKSEDNLVYSSMKRCFDKIGYNVGQRGFRIRIESEIPKSRGLGSSAACILGGVLGANEIAGSNLSKREILELATEIEGHPDNVSPALFGGMQVSIKEGSSVYNERINLHEGIKFCAIIPNFTLSTRASREVLPQNISHKDAAFNVGRASLLIAALSNGNLGLLRAACMDKLHENYRVGLIRNCNEIVSACSYLNPYGVFLSGAGPTIMNIIQEENNEFSKDIEDFLSRMKDKWIVKELKPYNEGAVVRNIKEER